VNAALLPLPTDALPSNTRCVKIFGNGHFNQLFASIISVTGTFHLSAMNPFVIEVALLMLHFAGW
jgi:hypothetical protein